MLPLLLLLLIIQDVNALRCWSGNSNMLSSTKDVGYNDVCLMYNHCSTKWVKGQCSGISGMVYTYWNSETYIKYFVNEYNIQINSCVTDYCNKPIEVKPLCFTGSDNPPQMTQSDKAQCYSYSKMCTEISPSCSISNVQNKVNVTYYGSGCPIIDGVQVKCCDGSLCNGKEIPSSSSTMNYSLLLSCFLIVLIDKMLYRY